MREKKWTPGPWKDGKAENGKYIIYLTKTGFLAGLGKEEHYHNLCLSDAAPELVEALEYVKYSMENDPQINDIDFANELYEINTALAKAYGEEEL